MAWYALWKWFIQFRKRPYTNWVVWYSNKLYDEWFDSLTEEQQKKIIEYRRKKEAAQHKRAQQSLAMMSAMCAMLDKRSNGALSAYSRLTGMNRFW